MIFIHTWHRGYIRGRDLEVALRALRVRCVLGVKHFSQRAQRLRNERNVYPDELIPSFPHAAWERDKSEPNQPNIEACVIFLPSVSSVYKDHLLGGVGSINHPEPTFYNLSITNKQFSLDEKEINLAIFMQIWYYSALFYFEKTLLCSKKSLIRKSSHF